MRQITSHNNGILRRCILGNETFTKNSTDEVLNHVISVVISQIGNDWNIEGGGEGGQMIYWSCNFLDYIWKWLEGGGGGGKEE